MCWYICVACKKTAIVSVVAKKATVKAVKTMTRKGEKYITVKKAEVKKRKEEKTLQEDDLLDSNRQIVQENVPIYI